MSKDYSISDYRKLKKISSFAKLYKSGVSTSAIYKMKNEGKLDILEIDGVQFIDITTLPEEIKKNLKK